MSTTNSEAPFSLRENRLKPAKELMEGTGRVQGVITSCKGREEGLGLVGNPSGDFLSRVS